MLSFVRKSDSTFSTHSIVDVLEQCVNLVCDDYDLKNKYDFRQIEIVREYKENLPEICCESGNIQQVFLNILKNGAEAMLEGTVMGEAPKPCFVLRLEHEKDTGMVRIEIEDNGPGMPEEVSRHIFEPFFSTKPTKPGAGLGLSACYFIITENHQGLIMVESAPEKGAKFVIKLPVERKITLDEPVNTELKFSKKLVAWHLFFFILNLLVLAAILSLQIDFYTALKIVTPCGVVIIVIYALILITDSAIVTVSRVIKRMIRCKKQ
ncbi:MAG: hypothetical protein GY847_36800 [Proteobacteria bacterium]|nr:hypothetical protein [Pseudomonadota bacterium]